MNPVSIRLLNQQLIAQQFSTPAEVVRYMGAMQAQEYRMMRWAVAMRTRKPSCKAFKKAFDEGQIIRLHLMRGTWQLVCADDYWSMIDLFAPKAIAVTRSTTKEDFVQALAEKDLQMDDHRLSYHIRMAEMAGVLCSGDLLPMKATYALTADKVKSAAKMDREEALALFTKRYFQSRQPATLEDFVWWSGLNIRDCRKGIALLGNSIHVERWKGREFYLTDECRTRGFRSGKFLLIPPYDEYLISYKSRDIALPAEHRHRAHNNSGIFQPIIAYDGTICGNWSPFKNDFQASFFDDCFNVEEVKEAWLAYQKFANRFNPW